MATIATTIIQKGWRATIHFRFSENAGIDFTLGDLPEWPVPAAQDMSSRVSQPFFSAQITASVRDPTLNLPKTLLR
jgi:hypothetical protein